MQKNKERTESILPMGIKLTASAAFALVLMFLLTMLNTGIALLLDEVPHETVFSWLKYPVFIVTGFVAGRIFAALCNLKGVVCGILAAALLLLVLWFLRAVLGIQDGTVWGMAIALLCSAISGSVVSACRRS